VLASAVALTPAAAQAHVRVSIKPGSGRPTTSFSVSFLSPHGTGRLASIRRTDRLNVTGPEARGRCVSRHSITLPATRKGHRVRVTLNPRKFGGAWCVGRFHGSVLELRTRICTVAPQRACPLVMIPARTIARFSFRVRPARSGNGGGHAQTRGPTFAGIVGAATCIGLRPLGLRPRVAPRERSYRLTWNPASDPVTPSSQIVYDVYYSTAPGGENFAQPGWTSPPGATTFALTLPQTSPAYFVVRARDQAGLEDRNTVERQGVNQCG
jgi:hypothetical protein